MHASVRRPAAWSLLIGLALVGCKKGEPTPDDSGDTGDTGEAPVPEVTWATLVETETLAASADGCTWGGVLLKVGLDDGAGGGTPGDGVLQDGEVRSTEEICAGAPGSSSYPLDYLPTGAPAGADGTHAFVAHGGEGLDGAGGAGGQLYLLATPGSRYGHVRIHRTGDVSPTIDTTLPTPDLGPVPWTFDADDTIEVLSGMVIEPPSNAPYQWEGDAALYVYTSTTGQRTVTGFHVESGVTVTFRDIGSGTASVQVPDGVFNEGTLTTPIPVPLVFTPDRTDLTVTAGAFVGAAGSRIDLAGVAGTDSTPGGDGGVLRLYGDSGPYLTGGAILNLGDILAHGAPGSPSGSAGSVEIQGFLRTVQAGMVDVSAGRGLGGALSSNAGALVIRTQYGPTSLSGAVNATGVGAGSSPSTGGTVVLQGMGIVSDADIALDGGAPKPNDCAPCDGGGAGQLSIATTGGRVVLGGTITGVGADGVSDGGGGRGNGGPGGGIDITATAGALAYPARSVPAMGVELGVDIDVHGGSGDVGGPGGRLVASTSAMDAPGFEIRMLGVSGIDLHGADGTTIGGPGGIAQLYQSVSVNSGVAGPTGGLLLDPDIDLSGGAGGVDGANGGTLFLIVDDPTSGDAWGEIVEANGTIDVSGGNGTNSGGPGGLVQVQARGDLTCAGDVLAGGGDADGAGGTGGSAAGGSWDGISVFLRSAEGVSLVSGDVVSSGGDGGSAGGAGAIVDIRGAGAILEGDVDAHGGAGGIGTGGKGGGVNLYGSDMPAAYDGEADVSGGAGDATDGLDGRVYVDGVPVEP